MDDRDRKRAKKEKHAKERSSRPEKKVRTPVPSCDGGWPNTTCCPCLSVCCVGYLIIALALPEALHEYALYVCFTSLLNRDTLSGYRECALWEHGQDASRDKERDKERDRSAGTRDRNVERDR